MAPLDRIVTDVDRLHVVSDEIRFDAKTKHLARRLTAAATVNPRGALGLAAPQIGVTKRAFYWNLRAYKDRGGLGGHGVAFNPTVVDVSAETWDLEEGCLSFPVGQRPIIRRPKAVAVRYFDAAGSDWYVELAGMPARVWLHEIDHLDGRTFVDRAANPDLPYI